ncbi:MAG: glycosyltransferase family 4 protein [Solirubrobacterales bacterium]
MALQEAEVASLDQAEALVHAVSALEGINLVFLGGHRWSCRSDLARTAVDAGVVGRVHFVSDVPRARRVAYLHEVDVGLALAVRSHSDGRLPAADVFEMLGIPYITLNEPRDPEPESRIVSGDDPEALSAAIVAASQIQRVPEREEGATVLGGLIEDLAREGGEQDAADAPPAASRSTSEVGIGKDRESTGKLLEHAKALRERGEDRQAQSLYMQVIEGSGSGDAMATAAAGLARLGARGEAQAAIERVMNAVEPSPLATVRIAEAAALLGNFPQARARVDEVLGEASAPDLALRGALRVLERVGEPRVALRVARRVGDQASVSRILGTLESYDPTWLPTSGRVSARAGSRTRRSLTLLETSLPHSSSGYTYRAQTLLRAQLRAGIEPTALTRLGFPASRGISPPASEEVDGVVHHRASLPGDRRQSAVPISEQLEENVRWAAAIARDTRPEGIIATTPHLNGLVGLALRRELGVPLIYDVRGFPEMTWAVRDGGGDTDVYGLRRVAETRCMREADLVTTLSETMRKHILSRGISAEKVFVLPHAVDTAAFAPRECDLALAAKLGLTGRSVVGYISSLVAYEGIETLLDAILLARRRDPKLAGLIVGGGDMQPSLEAQARQLGLDGHIVFTGRVEASEVARYYSLTDVFVCPRHDHEVTRYVTPLKPFEAMAAGCCLAVSDLPTLREAVRDGECGALFRPGDAEALAVTILDLVGRPEYGQKLRHAARDHVVANHGFDTLCTRFGETWEELMRRAAVSASANRGKPGLAALAQSR